MGMFDRITLNDTEVAAARDLFERIIEAEKDRLTDEQKADPRSYLTTVWRTAAETVMRPLQRVEDLANDLLARNGYEKQVHQYETDGVPF